MIGFSDFMFRVVTWLGAFLLGVLLHEAGHYAIGWLSGGDPFVAQFSYGFPSLIDFQEPHSMADWQVRILGGHIYIYWIVAVVGLWFHWPILAWFGIGGGSIISFSDLNAAEYPDVWKRITAGDSVTKEDWYGDS